MDDSRVFLHVSLQSGEDFKSGGCFAKKVANPVVRIYLQDLKGNETEMARTNCGQGRNPVYESEFEFAWEKQARLRFEVVEEPHPAFGEASCHLSSILKNAFNGELMLTRPKNGKAAGKLHVGIAMKEEEIRKLGESKESADTRADQSPHGSAHTVNSAGSANFVVAAVTSEVIQRDPPSFSSQATPTNTDYIAQALSASIPVQEVINAPVQADPVQAMTRALTPVSRPEVHVVQPVQITPSYHPAQMAPAYQPAQKAYVFDEPRKAAARWQYQEKGQWEDYQWHDSEECERHYQRFQSGGADQVKLKMNNREYSIHFKKMTQMSFPKHIIRKIRRQEEKVCL